MLGTTERRDLRRRIPCRYRARRQGLDRRTRLTRPSRPLQREGLDRHAAASSLFPSSIGLCAAHPLMSAVAVLADFGHPRALAHVTKPKWVLGEISSAVSSEWLTGHPPIGPLAC